MGTDRAVKRCVPEDLRDLLGEKMLVCECCLS